MRSTAEVVGDLNDDRARRRVRASGRALRRRRASRTQRPSPTRICIRRGCGEDPAERMVEREEPRGDGARPLDVEQIAPERRFGLQRACEHLDAPPPCRRRDAALEVRRMAVDRVARRPSPPSSTTAKRFGPGATAPLGRVVDESATPTSRSSARTSPVARRRTCSQIGPSIFGTSAGSTYRTVPRPSIGGTKSPCCRGSSISPTSEASP